MNLSRKRIDKKKKNLIMQCDHRTLKPNSSVIRASLKTELTGKQRTPDFLKNKNFLSTDTHTCVCVSGGKKCLFFRKFGDLCFLVNSVLRFAFLPHYRRFMRIITKITTLNLNHIKPMSLDLIIFTELSLSHYGF